MIRKPITIGLVVLGSLALAALIIGLNATTATAEMIYARAAQIDPGSGNTDVYVMDTSGSGAAVVVDYYPYNSSTSAGQKTVTLNAYGSVEILSSDGDVGLGDGFLGTAIVASDVQVAAVAVAKWPTNTRAGAYKGFEQGASTQNLPFLIYTPNVRDWSLAVFNVGSSETTISMTYYNRAGALDFVISDTIPAGQQGYYDSAAGGPTIPTWTDSSFYNTNGTWSGAIVIETDETEDRIAAVMTHHYRTYSAQYGSIATGDSTVFVPYVARRSRNSGALKIVASNLSIQNLTGATTVVTTTFIDNVSGSTDLVLVDTIDPYSLVSFNTLAGGQTHLRSEFFALDRTPPADSGTDTWVGSAIVESDGADLAVVVSTLRKEEDVFGQYAAGGQSGASTECFYPAGFRVGPSTKYNQVRLQNPGTTDATDVDFYFYDRDGTETTVAAYGDLTIEGEKSKGYLLKAPDLSALGTNWVGGFRITSDQPLLCTTDLLMDTKTRMASYEATAGP